MKAHPSYMAAIAKMVEGEISISFLSIAYMMGL